MWLWLTKKKNDESKDEFDIFCMNILSFKILSDGIEISSMSRFAN